MRIALLTAVATVSLLGACRQAEDRPNNVAADTDAAANAVGNAATPAAAPVSPEEAQRLFNERHEGMEDIGDATKAVGQQLKCSTPDVGLIQKSAATINDLAAKSGSWFPPGTGQDVLPKTRAKAEIWQQPQDFVAKDRDFQQAARAFNAAAASGNLDAIRSSFETLGKACKACHDSYRAKEHPK